MTSWSAYLFWSFLWDDQWLRTRSCWSYKLSYRHLDGENQSSHFNLVEMNSELVLAQLCTVNVASVMTSKILKMIQEINLSTWLFCKFVFCIISGEAVLSCASHTPTDACSWGTLLSDFMLPIYIFNYSWITCPDVPVCVIYSKNVCDIFRLTDR